MRRLNACWWRPPRRQKHSFVSTAGFAGRIAEVASGLIGVDLIDHPRRRLNRVIVTVAHMFAAYSGSARLNCSTVARSGASTRSRLPIMVRPPSSMSGPAMTIVTLCEAALVRKALCASRWASLSGSAPGLSRAWMTKSIDLLGREQPVGDIENHRRDDKRCRDDLRQGWRLNVGPAASCADDERHREVLHSIALD